MTAMILTTAESAMTPTATIGPVGTPRQLPCRECLYTMTTMTLTAIWWCSFYGAYCCRFRRFHRKHHRRCFGRCHSQCDRWCTCHPSDGCRGHLDIAPFVLTTSSASFGSCDGCWAISDRGNHHNHHRTVTALAIIPIQTRHDSRANQPWVVWFR